MRTKKVYKLALFFLGLSLLGVSSSCSKVNTYSDLKSEEAQINKAKNLNLVYTRKVFSVQEKNVRTELLIYEFNPEMVEIKLHQNDVGMRIEEWSVQTGADIIVNGGYFDEKNEPTGKFIINGQEFGKSSYDLERSATLLIKDGLADIIDTSISKLPEVTQTTSLLQSFPVLIKNSQAAITSDSEKLARRTVIAKTKNKTMLLIVVDQTPVSLYELMNILLRNDLAIEIALNLDGGQSTGIVTHIEGFSEKLLPITTLPQVISITAKN